MQMSPEPVVPQTCTHKYKYHQIPSCRSLSGQDHIRYSRSHRRYFVSAVPAWYEKRKGSSFASGYGSPQRFKAIHDMDRSRLQLGPLSQTSVNFSSGIIDYHSGIGRFSRPPISITSKLPCILTWFNCFFPDNSCRHFGNLRSCS